MMRSVWKKLHRNFKLWGGAEDGVAAMEAAFVFPLLLILFLGVFDMGNGILANQKAIRASQVTADLIARSRTVDAAMIDDAVEAGRLSFQPMDTSTFGVDIVSVRFDDDANPVIVWRETRNMTPVSDVLSDVVPLAEAGSGVLVVAVEYQFEPLFGNFVIDAIPMQEIAFARGRRSPVVWRN